MKMYVMQSLEFGHWCLLWQLVKVCRKQQVSSGATQYRRSSSLRHQGLPWPRGLPVDRDIDSVAGRQKGACQHSLAVAFFSSGCYHVEHFHVTSDCFKTLCDCFRLPLILRICVS
jgi:hypothetical protein